MVERICPTCQHGNPLDDRFCGKCGAPLERQLLMRKNSSPLTIAGRSLPVTWQQLGKTVALSVVALAAEAGLAWLRRRIEAGVNNLPASLPSPPPAQQQNSTRTTLTRPSASITTIISQRVIEIRNAGDGYRQTIERTFWRKYEE